MMKFSKVIANSIFGLLLAATIFSATAQAQIQESPTLFFDKLWLFGKPLDSADKTRISKGNITLRRGGISHANRGNFDLGSAFVRAAYYSANCNQSKETENQAILELVRLSARLDGQTESTELDAAVKMVARGQGTKAERWSAVSEISDRYSSKLAGEQRWYFQLAGNLMRLTLANYQKNETSIRLELQNLSVLSKIAPETVHAEIIKNITELTVLTANGKFTESETLAIDNHVGKLMEFICG